MNIKFKNWEKYQGRKDINKITWFRFDKDTFLDARISTLNVPDERDCFIVLLCEACNQNNNGTVFINHDNIQRMYRISSQVINQTLKKLKKLQVIEIRTLRGCYASDTEMCSTNVTNVTNERTNNTYMSSGDDECENKINSNSHLEESNQIKSGIDILVKAWNENCGSLPLVKSKNSERNKKAALRFKEQPDPDYWASIARTISKNDFCNGKNESGWKANFDFFIKPDTHVKVSEGSYGQLLTKENENTLKKVLERDEQKLIENKKNLEKKIKEIMNNGK